MADIFDLFRQIANKKEEKAGAVEWIVSGLGNPGEQYRNTRHNAGFLTVDALADSLGLHIDRMRFHALTAEASISDVKVLLLKPMTMMNLSGIAIAEAARFYKIPAERVVVISDDINLDVGKIRVRKSGSDGGQRGLRSIITLMGNDNCPRIRLGVGKKPHPDYDLADWVLSEFSKDDQEKIFACFGKAYDGLVKILEGDVEAAMQICNGK